MVITSKNAPRFFSESPGLLQKRRMIEPAAAGGAREGHKVARDGHRAGARVQRRQVRRAAV